jgi:ribosomal protein S18 acetylase RimI-like enzyme
MQVRNLHADDIETVRALLCANGWEHRLGNAEQFAQLVRNSQRTAVACEGSSILGFARGITDDLSNGYLSMVVVSPEHRRIGIGRALVAHIIGDGNGITWVLRAGREGASDFFGKLGFTASVVAMERVRA